MLDLVVERTILEPFFTYLIGIKLLNKIRNVKIWFPNSAALFVAVEFK
jgi:hypothetical protein